MKKRPYWNFWKVVLAGWMIKYPHIVFRPIMFLVGIFLVLIYNAIVN